MGVFFGSARLHGCTCCGQWSQCLRGQHLLARLLCGCLCGAAGITGRPFTPAQTAIRSPSPSPALSSIIPLLRFSPNPPCVPDCRRPHFILYIPTTSPSVCLSVCASASVWPPPFPSFLALPPTSRGSTNSSSCNSFTVKKKHIWNEIMQLLNHPSNSQQGSLQCTSYRTAATSCGNNAL